MVYQILPAIDSVTPYDAARDQYIQQGIYDAQTMAASAGGGVRDLVSLLLDSSEFYIAHRGCGDEAPEHSEHSYRRALGEGYAAVEMSACSTGDGALVCIHDSTLDRTTTLTGPVSAKSLGQLREPIMDYGGTYLGPGASANLPLPILGAEIALWMGRGVIFLEPKTDGPRTLAAVTQYEDPGSSVVWKFGRASNGTLPQHAQAARAAGLKLWPYMTLGDANSLVDTVLATVGASGGALGMPIEASDASIEYAVDAADAYGLPVIVWAVQKRSQRDRLRDLGVRGFMCTNISYVSRDDARFTTDGFSTGVRRAGQWLTNVSKVGTFTVSASTGHYQVGQGTDGGIVMGDMSPVPDRNTGGGYRIAWEMKWPTLPGDTTGLSGLWFGHDEDDSYTFQGTANQPGYHVFSRVNGALGLSAHVNGSSSSTALGSASASAAVADTWIPFNVDVTPTQVIFRRLDTATTITVSNTTYPGRYFGLFSGSSAVAPAYRNIVVSAL